MRRVDLEAHYLTDEYIAHLGTRDEAPRDTGAFADGLKVRHAVQSMGSGLDQFEIRSTGPHATVGNGLSLWQLITRGTQPHVIPRGGAPAQMAKGYPLSFYWGNGPRGPGLYHYWSVNHPGTKPNRFVDRALDRWRPEARRELREFGLFLSGSTESYF